MASQALSAVVFALAVSCIAPVRARAEGTPYRLALLELESDAVHDNFAKRLTERLRAALSERHDFELRYAPVSLAQLSLAHDCDTSRIECLSTIARELKLDGFLFGKATHEGGALVAVLRRYDLHSESVDRSALVSFASLEVGQPELEHGAQELLARLLGGSIPRRPAPPAPHPTAPVAATEHAEQPQRADTGTSGQSIVGYALLATAVVSAGMAVASFVLVDKAENNVNYKNYRLAVGDTSPDVRDVCGEAEAGRSYGLDAAKFRDVKSSCSAGRTFELLQYVFIATTVISGGVSAYLLASDDTESEDSARQALRVRLAPRLSQRELGLGASLRF